VKELPNIFAGNPWHVSLIENFDTGFPNTINDLEIVSDTQLLSAVTVRDIFF